MDLSGRHILITGGGSGIGAALADRFAKENPRGITVVDLVGADETAARVGGLALDADVSKESEVVRVIAEATRHYGPVDVYFSNAGIPRPLGGAEVSDDGWQRHWDTHVMSHVWATRALLPGMISRGSGYLVNTASAAGLLMSPGASPYTVTKHAAVALAESFAVMYSHTGIRFSCLCPGLVETPLVSDVDNEATGRAIRMTSQPMDPATVADIAVRGLIEERFLIMTHGKETSSAAQLRASDPETYVSAMQDLWRTAQASS
ncbi:NAD(P)-dependent dehydrogenase (short-subunit alcohol dehydrogenase family) [Kibdelosporangium banguiense]|uniref:NAD(P)-dependent dehydrogenase (Short-subunit alcohol dehydrogenase family) n=1 Tax=Kibdelosporangium banguiense TaxID=1365924 RepID=A0ABS4TR20_9PSEU|nr:SDR family oxidoreductase [Kibdelosporangium banguiense]MBP2326321.1 NAD(P)-dependent dehydrogenase (short-subunit alcohol dehydrogenase family) [Kibdelosporangium banguiense]